MPKTKKKNTAKKLKTNQKTSRYSEEIKLFEEFLNEDELDILEEISTEQSLFEIAQNKANQAFEETKPAKKVQLAIEALSIHSKCSDAWYILGLYASERLDIKLGLFNNGIGAAEEYFEDLGDRPMWLDHETRPYMRCRHAVMMTLWEGEMIDEAIEQAWLMIEDNEDDNLGVRYNLLSWLLSKRDIQNCSKLLDKYSEDDLLNWKMGRVLFALQQTPEDRSSYKQDLQALLDHKYFKDYILGKKLPKFESDYIEIGGETEVVEALVNFECYKTSNPVEWARFVDIFKNSLESRSKILPVNPKNSRAPKGSSL